MGFHVSETAGEVAPFRGGVGPENQVPMHAQVGFALGEPPGPGEDAKVALPAPWPDFS